MKKIMIRQKSDHAIIAGPLRSRGSAVKEAMNKYLEQFPMDFLSGCTDFSEGRIKIRTRRKDAYPAEKTRKLPSER